MITLTRNQSVGHDILMARHGNHITSMRVDSANGTVIALLDDGSVDTAPNSVSVAGLGTAETVGSTQEGSWKLPAAWLGMTAVMLGLMVAAAVGISTSLDPDSLEMLNSYSAYGAY
ncbi:hypothetical protein PSET11_00767 [Arthrobacter ulcerisalmonis]|uniref:Uncharacterized protein n=1 Tax=Arthrobacter ulcerisalmonis TaxID=2483813 RepID=A0A3P5WIV2_9MICC|nr:hypothetical protein [Arthrobacter ulcerisalmonis]VDC21405.1 hypothetical protein PSET11_00767 [Arthrobacter ulcerisalmonis]